MFPLLQAFPRAETKWRRDDAALPGARVSHNQHEGKHVVEIRWVDISTNIYNDNIYTIHQEAPAVGRGRVHLRGEQ